MAVRPLVIDLSCIVLLQIFKKEFWYSSKHFICAYSWNLKKKKRDNTSFLDRFIIIIIFWIITDFIIYWVLIPSFGKSTFLPFPYERWKGMCLWEVDVLWSNPEKLIGRKNTSLRQEVRKYKTLFYRKIYISNFLSLKFFQI